MIFCWDHGDLCIVWLVLLFFGLAGHGIDADACCAKLVSEVGDYFDSCLVDECVDGLSAELKWPGRMFRLVLTLEARLKTVPVSCFGRSIGL